MNLHVSHRPDAARHGRLPPATRGGPARVLFLSTDVLGWRTSSRQLVAATEARDDVAAVHVLIRAPLWMKVLNRRVPGLSDHLITPTTTRRWMIGRWLDGPLPLRCFDLVYCNSQSNALAVADRKAVAGVRLAISCDTTDVQNDRELRTTGLRRAPKDRAAFAAADLVVPWSRWCAGSLTADYGVPAERLLVTPPVVRPDDTAPAPPASPKRVVFVGNDWRRKGGPRLLAWHRAHWASRGVELHVASADAAGFAPEPTVFWHGRLDHAAVMALIRTATVLVHPTTFDMSALVVAEAAAVGVPAVASRLAGIPDLVDDGVSGYLVDPHDDAAFVAAAERVLFDDAEHARLVEGTRRFARQSLDAGVVYRRLMDRLVALARGESA